MSAASAAVGPASGCETMGTAWFEAWLYPV